MENRTVIINGVSYTCLTDEEYEDLQTVAAYEERKKSKDFLNTHNLQVTI